MIIKQSNDSEFKNTRIGRIPQDWELLKIEDVALKVTDGTHDTPKPTEKGVPYITAIHVKDGHINFDACYYVSEEVHEQIYKRCNPEKDDLLIVNIGAGTATPARVKVDYQFSMKNVALIKPNPSKLNGAYLEAYQLFVKKKLFRRLTSGGAQPFLSLKEIKKLDIVVPKLVEQQKIASILSTWDKAIELKEKLIEQKKEQKKGLMQKLLTGEVRLPGFEGEWREVKLGKIGKTYNGLSGKTAEDFGEGKPYIPYKTIFDDSKINLQKLDYVKINIGEKQNSAKKGDIFFTTSSETPHEVGMSSVLLDDVDEIYLNSFCFGYRLNDFSVLLPNFAQHYFRSDDFRKKIYALAQGSTRFNISKNEVMKIAIKIPDLKEQEGISKILSESDKEILLLANQVRRLKEQKQGLMQLLLTGKVRVKV